MRQNPPVNKKIIVNLAHFAEEIIIFDLILKKSRMYRLQISSILRNENVETRQVQDL